MNKHPKVLGVDEPLASPTAMAVEFLISLPKVPYDELDTETQESKRTKILLDALVGVMVALNPVTSIKVGTAEEPVTALVKTV